MALLASAYDSGIVSVALAVAVTVAAAAIGHYRNKTVTVTNQANNTRDSAYIASCRQQEKERKSNGF